MVATTSTVTCVGQSSRRSYYGGTQPLGRCKRGVAFAVMSYGRHGGHTAPELTCQAHLGGVVARRADEPRRAPATPRGVTVLPVRSDGMCPCGERPDLHEPGAACPAPL